eukprot:1156114-Pelagomonas_calceolata.AAC.1
MFDIGVCQSGLNRVDSDDLGDAKGVRSCLQQGRLVRTFAGHCHQLAGSMPHVGVCRSLLEASMQFVAQGGRRHGGTQYPAGGAGAGGVHGGAQRSCTSTTGTGTDAVRVQRDSAGAQRCTQAEYWQKQGHKRVTQEQCRCTEVTHKHIIGTGTGAILVDRHAGAHSAEASVDHQQLM